ncbi:hypothetical protein SR1949_26500 [Sphaerospermopsis reniformis]|jgi:hypothetical protein|uniref:Uncharacterized protein n=1 Tax=Sphaerospermopsis reniformis TaxID=531300 RepID=A0A479ZXW4_9CYAN|nr:hypothetical protein SR1949_26500 [Sphaerospermopsis reniformis]
MVSLGEGGVVSLICWLAWAINCFANSGAVCYVSITSLTTPTPKEVSPNSSK